VCVCVHECSALCQCSKAYIHTHPYRLPDAQQLLLRVSSLPERGGILGGSFKSSKRQRIAASAAGKMPANKQLHTNCYNMRTCVQYVVDRLEQDGRLDSAYLNTKC
jgi:hypothetical protein